MAFQDDKGSVYIPLAYDPVEAVASASRLVDALLPNWNLTPGEVQYTRLTQGISNVVCTMDQIIELWCPIAFYKS
jgi:hypothetical protein